MDDLRLHVGSARCGTCRAEVLALLDAVPGIGAVRVDLDRAGARVRVVSGRGRLDDVIEALRRGGHGDVRVDDGHGVTPGPNQSGPNVGPTGPGHDALARPEHPVPDARPTTRATRDPQGEPT